MSDQKQRFGERTTTLIGIPILQKHSPALVVNNIFNHNSLSGYTGILSIGHSGSGKTTIISLLSHLLHEKKHFAVYDYGAEELMDVNNIIKRMPVEGYETSRPAGSLYQHMFDLDTTRPAFSEVAYRKLCTLFQPPSRKQLKNPGSYLMMLRSGLVLVQVLVRSMVQRQAWTVD